MDKLVEIFCDVDDFCKVFIPQWELQQLADGTRKRQGKGLMTPSEIMSIIILFHMSTIEISKITILVISLIFIKLITQTC